VDGRVGGGGVGSHGVGSVVDSRIGSSGVGVSILPTSGRDLFLSLYPEFLLGLFFGRGERPSGKSLQLDSAVDFPVAVVTTEDYVIAFVFRTRPLSEQGIVDFLEEPGKPGRS
jgi:hypothetical protein